MKFDRKNTVKLTTVLVVMASVSLFMFSDVVNDNMSSNVSDDVHLRGVATEFNEEENLSIPEDEELPPLPMPHSDEPVILQTGSWANCTTVTHSTRSDPMSHPDEGSIMASCHRIFYRVPLESFERAAGESTIVGVLSSAGGEGPARRNSIRSTWAKNRAGIFFLVAGPWNQIADEYNQYGDLIWIDEEEIYSKWESVLTWKTYSFIAIAHELSLKVNGQYSNLFKTDDDSYVYMKRLNEILEAMKPEYYGRCEKWPTPPVRGPNFKWSMGMQGYPEPYYPRYCQGAGYSLSRSFARCAVEDGHIAHVRYIRFEDVAVGHLAERCNIQNIVTSGRYINLFRAGGYKGEGSERDRVNFNLPDPDDDSWIPPATMHGKVVQHRIRGPSDMEAYQRSVDNE